VPRGNHTRVERKLDFWKMAKEQNTKDLCRDMGYPCTHTCINTGVLKSAAGWNCIIGKVQLRLFTTVVDQILQFMIPIIPFL
jgi:hypothetical protein